MVRKEYDAIIIGAGNQGLSLAAYLQRSGMEVGIFERRNEEGGCIFSSECTAPGFIHNLHAQYMEFIDWMPFYYDFGLENLGGRMLYPEAQSGIAFSDGRPPIVLYSVEKEEHFDRTHRSISVYSKHDADTFVDLRKKALDAEDGFTQFFYNPPQMPSKEDPDPINTLGIGLMEILGLPHHIAKGSGKTLVDYLFETPELRALFYRMLVEWGCPVDMMNLGWVGVMAIFSISLNWRLCVGGTHTLAHAMAMACIREGVDIHETSEVKTIITKKGKAAGIRLSDGTEVKARKLVASSADIKQTLLGMVGEKNLSPLWVKRTKDFRYGPSCVLASNALALHEAPDFKSARHNPDINKTFYTVVGFDTPEEVLEYCLDAEMGRIPRIPGAGIWVNSLWDPTYAPPGKHSLTGWFFFPKASTHTREEWEEIRATYNDRFLERLVRWAPNMTRANVIDDYFYTPLDQQDDMRLGEGDFCNGAIAPDQMGYMRPFPEAAMYRTEIDRLYLCSSGQHPFGGASAGVGYNVFKVIAEDFGLKKFWEDLDREY